MGIRGWILLAVASVGYVACSDTQDVRAMERVLAGLKTPPAGHLYHGVYPGNASGLEDNLQPSDLEAYQQAVGRSVAWVYFSNNWYNSRAFPGQSAEWIRSKGAVPYIRLMLRSSPEINVAEPLYTLQAIKRGDFDADLEAWGKAAAAFGTPLVVEWGTEVNGKWFAWNGWWNGQSKGPELFRQTYRHIVNKVTNAGATNITWVWHVSTSDDPETPWNRLEAYYPGGDVVSWIGVSVYGGQSPRDPDWPSFSEEMDAVMPRLSKLAPTKPVFVVEFGASAGHPAGTPEAWANQALSQLLSGRWPSVRGFSWWNEGWANDTNPANNTEMRVQNLPKLAETFRKHLASPKVLDRPLFP